MITKKFIYLLCLTFLIIGNQSFLAQPANDSCSSPEILIQTTGIQYISGSTLFATPSGIPDCEGNADDDVWYTFNATKTQATLVVLGLQNMWPYYEFRADSCAGEVLYCSGVPEANDTNHLNLQNLVIGKDYFIRVYHGYAGSNSGEFKISLSDIINPIECISPSVHPANTANDCDSIPLICSNRGFCGSTTGYRNNPGDTLTPFNVSTWSELTSPFCGSFEMNSFYRFRASDTLIDFLIHGTCYFGKGLQFLIYEKANQSSSRCDSIAINSIFCEHRIQFPLPTSEYRHQVGSLIIGREYFICIDPWAGDNCDYEFVFFSGIERQVSITPNIDTLCIGESLALIASGGLNGYQWDSSPLLNSTTNDTVIASFTSPGDYAFSVYSASPGALCEEYDTCYIHVQSQASPMAGNDIQSCIGDTTYLEGLSSFGDSQTWWILDSSTSGGNVQFIGSNQTDTVLCLADSLGDYILIIHEQRNHCSAVSDTLVLSLIEGNPLTFTSTPICAGDPTTITVSGAQSYFWSNGLGTSPTITIAPDSSTMYYVVGYNGTCYRDDSVTQVVYPSPSIQFQWPMMDTLCLQEPKFALSGGSPNGGFYSGIGVLNSEFDPIVAGVGPITLFYSFTSPFNCTSSDSVEILIEDCLVLPQIENNQTNIYPNPASSSVTVTMGNSDDSKLFIYDNLGRLIEGLEIKGMKQTIDIRHFNSGIYTFMLIESNGSTVHFNLIIE
jgi:hypothetical protein